MPRGALIVMAVALVVLIGGTVVAAGREAPELSQDEADRLDAAEAAAIAEDEAREAARLDVLIIGDSYTAGSDEGGNGTAGWATQAAARLIDQGYDLRRYDLAAGGSGYVEAGPSGDTFVNLATQAPEGMELVVVFGSRNDGSQPEEVIRAAAAQTYELLLAASPEARLLVIGPPWVNDRPPAAILAARDAVEEAAVAAGATFVDPIEAGWFAGDAEEFIGGDGVHPTDEGHRYLADLITPLMAEEAADLRP